jgi:very-short-patch-repair endonuclease
MALKKLKSASKRSIIRKARKIAKVKRIKKCPVRKASDITVSKIELMFEKFMLDLDIPVKPQFQINYKFFDFIIEGTKILIEVDGSYWHCDPRLYPNGPENKVQKNAIINDLYKNRLAAANGYLLIRVWESDFKEQPRSVAKRIKQIIKEQTEAA